MAPLPVPPASLHVIVLLPALEQALLLLLGVAAERTPAAGASWPPPLPSVAAALMWQAAALQGCCMSPRDTHKKQNRAEQSKQNGIERIT
jgi:hypothetical protein